MKLSQKIFLCVFAFVMLGVNMIAVTVLSINQQSNLERARQQAVTSHQYITAGISNKVVYERVRHKKFCLSGKEVREILEKITRGGYIGVDGICIEYDEETVASSKWNMDAVEFRDMITDDKNIWSVIKDCGNKKYAVAASVKGIEGGRYNIYSYVDISDLFESFDRQFTLVQWLSVAAVGILGVILQLMFWYFLRPLKKINKALDDIAEGDYSIRIKKQGSLELQELAENINSMAESVEANDQKIRSIAEGRKRFIDSFAHEMKTPLTSILGFADIMRVKKGISEEQRREFSGIIVDETNRLRTLSDKLLQISVAEHIDLDLQPIYLPEFFDEIREIVSLTVKKRGVTLIAESDRIFVVADKELFASLILNFIDNAVKASDDGGCIRLKAKKERGIAHITVADNGIGMTEEQIQHVEEPFYMADKSRSRKNGGAGLGLALCAEIVKRHNMKFKIVSELGKGTVVHLLAELSHGEESV